MANAARFTRHNGKWRISVPIEMEIPFDRRVPVQRWRANSTSYLQIAEKPVARKTFPSGTYDIYDIKKSGDLQNKSPDA